MSARLEEVLLESYRVDPEGLRDLAAIVGQGCHEIDASIEPEFEVRRRDSLRYTTGDIEDVLKERNGRETGIKSLTIRAKQDGLFELEIGIGRTVEIVGQAEDRAKLLLLTSDVRALVHERMKWGFRKLWSPRDTFTVVMALAMFWLLVFLLATSLATDGMRDRYDREVSRMSAAHDRVNQSYEVKRSEQLAVGEKAADSGTIDDKLAFLARAEPLRQERDIELGKAGKYPSYPKTPWYWTSPLSGIVVVSVAVGASYLILWALFRGGAVFLIGEEVNRQRRISRRRDRILWGVGVSFLLGIASSIVASFLGA